VIIKYLFFKVIYFLSEVTTMDNPMNVIKIPEKIFKFIVAFNKIKEIKNVNKIFVP